MKVLAIAQTIKVKSGWGRYARSIVDEFARRDIQYKILTLADGGKVAEEEPMLLPATSILNILKNCFLVRRKARDFEIVHAFDAWPFAIYGYAAVLWTRKKLFVTGVATYSVVPTDRLLKKFFMTRALRAARKIMCSSEYTRQRILKTIDLKNTARVFWGPSPLPSVSEGEIESFYQQFDVPKSNHPILLTVGQIKFRKGQFDTTRAVSLLRKKYPQILYVMVGSDADTEYVGRIKEFVRKEKLTENIRIITTAKDDKALSFFYTISDAFIINSNNEEDHFEGFGLVFLEAEQFGKPVIGSRNCGIEEALEDGYNGYLTNQQDAGDSAEKINRILQADKTLFGRNSKEFYSRFSWQKTVGVYIHYYEQ